MRASIPQVTEYWDHLTDRPALSLQHPLHPEARGEPTPRPDQRSTPGTARMLTCWEVRRRQPNLGST